MFTAWAGLIPSTVHCAIKAGASCGFGSLTSPSGATCAFGGFGPLSEPSRPAPADPASSPKCPPAMSPPRAPLPVHILRMSRLAPGCHGAPHHLFRHRVFAANARHVPRAVCFGQAVFVHGGSPGSVLIWVSGLARFVSVGVQASPSTPPRLAASVSDYLWSLEAIIALLKMTAYGNQRIQNCRKRHAQGFG